MTTFSVIFQTPIESDKELCLLLPRSFLFISNNGVPIKKITQGEAIGRR